MFKQSNIEICGYLIDKIIDKGILVNNAIDFSLLDWNKNFDVNLKSFKALYYQKRYLIDTIYEYIDIFRDICNMFSDYMFDLHIIEMNDFFMDIWRFKKKLKECLDIIFNYHKTMISIKYNNIRFKGKTQIHKIIRKKKQKPKYCEICNEYKEKLDLSSIDHYYTLFPKDYMYLCRSCHGLYHSQKRLLIFTKEQKEYVWKCFKKYGIAYKTITSERDGHKYRLTKKYLLECLSKTFYYYFILKERYLVKKELIKNE